MKPEAFLLDIDGTTLLGPDALPGAGEFVTHLRERGIPHLWVTNNTSLSREGWRSRLEAAGLSPRPQEVYTAGDATIDHLRSLDPVPRIHLVGTPELAADFEAAGLVLVDEDPEALVLGYDLGLTYEKLRRAALWLQRGVPFYATHPDPTCPSPEGPVPDVGSFLALFETACGRRPVVIGKPEPTMVRGALGRLGVEAGDAVMVGDRLTTDIRMANRAGIRSYLVLTGVTAREDLVGAEDRPSEVFDSLAAVLARLRSEG
jgi:HAD superfamily hydrolase (TIGR01457 family)